MGCNLTGSSTIPQTIHHSQQENTFSYFIEAVCCWDFIIKILCNANLPFLYLSCLLGNTLWILCNIYKNKKRVLSDLKLQWICPITLMSYVHRMLNNKKDRIHVIVFFNCRYNVWVFHGELQHMKYIMSQISALQVSCDRPSQGLFFLRKCKSCRLSHYHISERHVENNVCPRIFILCI